MYVSSQILVSRRSHTVISSRLRRWRTCFIHIFLTIPDFNSDNLLTADAAIIFSLQKGFPERAVWRIIDTTTTGAQQANTVGDNVLQVSLAISTSPSHHDVTICL